MCIMWFSLAVGRRYSETAPWLGTVGMAASAAAGWWITANRSAWLFAAWILGSWLLISIIIMLMLGV